MCNTGLFVNNGSRDTLQDNHIYCKPTKKYQSKKSYNLNKWVILYILLKRVGTIVQFCKSGNSQLRAGERKEVCGMRVHTIFRCTLHRQHVVNRRDKLSRQFNTTYPSSTRNKTKLQLGYELKNKYKRGE